MQMLLRLSPTTRSRVASSRQCRALIAGCGTRVVPTRILGSTYDGISIIHRGCHGSHGPKRPTAFSISQICPGPGIGQRRGKRTKKVVSLDDLPQGPLEAKPLPTQPEEEVEEPSYPTVVLQAKRNMQKFDNCVLLTRVGGFYELYFEHAEEYGPLLNLKLAEKKTNAGPVPMVRLPAHLGVECPCY